MPTARPASVIGELSATVDYLRITVGGPADAWLRCAPLVSDPAALGARDRLDEGRSGHRSRRRGHVAVRAGLRVPRRLDGDRVWLLGGVVLDVAPAHDLDRHGPRSAQRRPPRRGDRDGAGVDRRRSPRRAGRRPPGSPRRHRPPGLPGRRGAALGERRPRRARRPSAPFTAPLPDRRVEIRDRAEAFFAAARPELRDAGRLVRVGEQFAWERRSCCLWYRTASAWMCDDCSLCPDGDRQERYRRACSRPRPPA